MPLPLASDAIFTVESLGLLAAASDAVSSGEGTAGASVLLRGYLIGWLFWLGLSLGGQVLVWLHNLTGGGWGKAIRRDCEAAGQTLPLVALGFLVIPLNLAALYLWARPEVMAHDVLIAKKHLWLNPTAFCVRAAIYFGVWLFMAWSVRRLERRAIADPTVENEREVRARSAFGILLYGLTMTFAAIDWGMSLEPHWFSGIYGVIFLIGQALAGLAFGTVRAMSRGMNDLPTPRPPSKDLGNMLLAFTMLWTYVAFSQFLIIWYADLPEEVIYYRTRLDRGWLWLGIVLLAFHFAAPFFALLSSDVKRLARMVSIVAVWQIVLRWFDLVWCVEPAFADSSAANLLMFAVVTLVLGVPWLAVFFWRYGTLVDRWTPTPPALGSATARPLHGEAH